MPGRIDITAMTAPQNTAESMPTTANPTPPSAPWIMPMIKVPFTVARLTDSPTLSIFSLSSCDNGP